MKAEAAEAAVFLWTALATLMKFSLEIWTTVTVPRQQQKFVSSVRRDCISARPRRHTAQRRARNAPNACSNTHGHSASVSVDLCRDRKQ